MNKIDRVKWLLETYGQNDQRTAAWHTKRGQMLTASEIYKGLPDATPAQRHELILSKLVPREYVAPGTGPRALLWGTQFEPIAKDIYCDLQFNHITIADTTCVPHATVPFLGASPDGIILTENLEDYRHGKLVEFKCPISRKFTADSPIPNGYYHQMQLQMECTGLDECEYIEMEFKELNYAGYLNTKAEYKSFFAVHEQTGDVLYKDFKLNEEYSTWKDRVLGENWDNYLITFWCLQSWRATTVKKQQGWLDLCLPSLTQVWAEVEEYRKTGTLPPPPKEKSVLVL